MSCPKYEGNSKCALHDPSYVLSTEHILSHCSARGFGYESCEELTRVSKPSPKPQKLERSCTCHGIKEEDCRAAHPPTFWPLPTM